jgi:phosphoribosylformylglycinamidine synthase subunit PurL
VLDLGDGLAVAFKVESHNHPSAVEPFQGAATGVGGILRDIIAMGARPIALLDGLRFGAPDHHFRRAVAGIGAYGNSVGVATVGGETVFDAAYADNCLVNAMCVGLLPVERVMSAKANGPGNLLVLFGATTGRDGIGGASVLASQDLGEGSEDKRPSVQVGNPFTGNKLIEVSVELVERELVESLQDCGAAGLASALSEMARDGMGVDVRLDRVPLREPDLEPWEIMISESQERMVAVVEPARLAEVEALFDRWELHHAVIGEVTDRGRFRAVFGDEELTDMPAAFLTDECPRYTIEQAPQRDLARADGFRTERKEWVYEQYDCMVGSRTVRRPGLDAAVLRLRPSFRGLAVSLQGPGRGERDPFRAGAHAVLEAALNVACAGGEPIGLTDCLNFGNPEKPEIAWELAQAIEGIARAAEALGIPVVSGNVSLYNETDGRAIPPTPVVGCVGLVPDVRSIPDRWREGDVVLHVSTGKPDDLEADAALVRWVFAASPKLSLAHDVSAGGIVDACYDAAIWSGIGLRLDNPSPGRGSQVVVACADPEALPDSEFQIAVLGRAGGESVGSIHLDDLRERRNCLRDEPAAATDDSGYEPGDLA